MPTLNLARQLQLVDDDPIDGPGCHVVTEPRKGVSKAHVAAIARHPKDPLGPWTRRVLKPSRTSWDASSGRLILVYAQLPDGAYEAHSTLRSREPQRVAFHVSGSAIEIVDPSCEFDNVIAHLNGLTPDALLRALRSRPKAPEVLVALAGSERQARWADTIRASMIVRAQIDGDSAAEALIHSVVDSGWFIENRDRSLAELPEPEPHQLARPPAGLLF